MYGFGRSHWQMHGGGVKGAGGGREASEEAGKSSQESGSAQAGRWWEGHESSAFEGSTHSPRLDQECGRAEKGIKIDSKALGLGGWSCRLRRWGSLGKSPLRGKSRAQF